MCTGGEGKEKKWEVTGRSHLPSLSSLSPSHHSLSQDAVIVSRDCSLTTYKIIIVVLLFPNHERLEMFCYFVFLHRRNTVLDPDLEIRGEGPVSPQFFFWSLGPQFGLDLPRQHNFVPRASWLPSLLLAIILYYRCHF